MAPGVVEVRLRVASPRRPGRPRRTPVAPRRPNPARTVRRVPRRTGHRRRAHRARCSPSCSTRRAADAAGPARRRGLHRVPRLRSTSTSRTPTSSRWSARPDRGSRACSTRSASRSTARCRATRTIGSSRRRSRKGERSAGQPHLRDRRRGRTSPRESCAALRKAARRRRRRASNTATTVLAGDAREMNDGRRAI